MRSSVDMKSIRYAIDKKNDTMFLRPMSLSIDRRTMCYAIGSKIPLWKEVHGYTT